MNLDNKLREYVQDNFTAPNSHVYHYTKPDLGQKITKSGIFQLSSDLELNKKNNREFKAGPEIIKTKLKNSSIERIITTFDEYMLKGLISFSSNDIILPPITTF